MYSHSPPAGRPRINFARDKPDLVRRIGLARARREHAHAQPDLVRRIGLARARREHAHAQPVQMHRIGLAPGCVRGRTGQFDRSSPGEHAPHCAVRHCAVRKKGMAPHAHTTEQKLAPGDPPATSGGFVVSCWEAYVRVVNLIVMSVRRRLPALPIRRNISLLPAIHLHRGGAVVVWWFRVGKHMYEL